CGAARPAPGLASVHRAESVPQTRVPRVGLQFGPLRWEPFERVGAAARRGRTEPRQFRYAFGPTDVRRDATGNRLTIFGFLRAKEVVSATENPRVGGSIPPLATI